ncbi:MAG: GNAT family N-acetyltransferase [Nakamurella sp.]
MLTTAAFRIDELPIPSSFDDPLAEEFVEMVGVRNEIEAGTLGSDALACTPEELLPIYQAQEFSPKRIFVARVEDRIVGRAVISWSIAPGSKSSWVSAEVLADHRHRGIGSALFEHVEKLALDSGRPILQSEILHTSPAGGERLPAPTGIGDLPLSDPGVQFLLGRGYRLEQTERFSFLDLPLDPAELERAYRAAEQASGPEYRIQAWSGPTPPDRVDDMITLRTRMSTDEPFAGLDFNEEPWTAARLASSDAAMEADGTSLTVAVEYLPTGQLVGFSDLVVPADRSRPAQQSDTLVLAEHRGHRLGMLLKLANLRALNAVKPAPPLISTCNAEENRYMLSVNEAVGFRPVGKAGAWRKIN